MNIPQVRTRLYEIATETGNDELKTLANELWRRHSVPRAPRDSTKFTPELRHSIREYYADHPEKTYRFIAEMFNVSIGRVSEALTGKRR